MCAYAEHFFFVISGEGLTTEALFHTGRLWDTTLPLSRVHLEDNFIFLSKSVHNIHIKTLIYHPDKFREMDN